MKLDKKWLMAGWPRLGPLRTHGGRSTGRRPQPRMNTDSGLSASASLVLASGHMDSSHLAYGHLVSGHMISGHLVSGHLVAGHLVSGIWSSGLRSSCLWCI